MQSNQWLMLLAFLYIGILFGVAWWGDRRGKRPVVMQALIYSLSLAVYCSSWTFFGAVGRAANSGWSYLPIYLGPILLFIFAWPFLRRLSVVAARNRVTSIADFIGSRYGKSQVLAALVTGLAVAGSLPYIALQLKATAQAWATVQGMWSTELPASSGNTSFIAALVLIVFTVLFGTRVADERHRHRGLMAAIAVESLVKLTAFVMVGVFAITVLLRKFSPGEALDFGIFSDAPEPVNFLTQGILAAAAIFCLPRQFHVMNVEYHSRRDLRTARWLFPLYLLLFAVLIIPIALAGQTLLPSNLPSADMFVLSAPLAAGNSELALIAMLGGLSAATGMVIVACVTLSIMICNEWVMPLWLAIHREHVVNARWLQRVRRFAIVAILFAAWLLEQGLSAREGLSSLGLISFAAAAQLAPVMLAAIYWRRAHRRGVIAGLIAGGGLWFYCLLMPAMLGQESALVANGPFGLALLAPQNLLGFGFLDPLSHGVFWSLLLNVSCLIGVSLLSRFRAIDLRQARVFTDLSIRHRQRRSDLELQSIEVWQLQRLLTPLLGEQRSQVLWRRFESRLGQRLLHYDRVPRFIVKEAEEALAAIIGAVSAHRTIDLLRSKKPLDMEEFVALIGTTSRDIKFGQDLLQITLETIPQGLSVVDANLDLVAWNHRYVELFGFPERLLYIGCPVARIYHYNAERGYLQDAENDVDTAVERRLNMLRSGQAYRLERSLPNGKVIEICGTPMSSGGYVTTYTDISEFQLVLKALEGARDELEQRVDERTSALAAANESLEQENRSRAQIEKELNQVYASKNRFLASASHDLLQPINAARLFTAALSYKAPAAGLVDEVKHIDEALAGAENLITSLREIARLDSGRMEIKRGSFPIQDLLDTLGREFNVTAQRSGIVLKVLPSSLWVDTDQHLLRRVIQNLLGNALRYTREGRVVLGCRRKGRQLSVEVWDTGPGIADEDRSRIFGEFERATDAKGVDGDVGLGLGLSIVQRISQLLGHPLGFASELGKGSMFSIMLPIVAPIELASPVQSSQLQLELAGLNVLCVDNEAGIRAGMQALLNQWQCHVCIAASLADALAAWKLDKAPDIILADYHLDQGQTGLDVLRAFRYHWDSAIPAIIISADNSDTLRTEVEQADCRFLTKPLKPAALRALMRKLIASSSSDIKAK